MKFYLGMDNSSYTKELFLISKSFAVLIGTAAIFFYYVIKTTPSNAESREDQDGSKHKFVGRMTAKIWPAITRFNSSTKLI